MSTTTADQNADVPLGWVLTLVPVFFLGGVMITATGTGHNILRKALLVVQGCTSLVLSKDSKWKHPEFTHSHDTDRDTIRVVFVRHGESVWNEVFNRGINVGFIFRFFGALIREFTLIPFSDSVFFDSPLGAEGFAQARTLLSVINADSQKPDLPAVAEDLAIVRGVKGKSVLASSNLRRAIQTAAIGFKGRLQRTHESIHILSSLQEVSRNVDCIPLASAREIPELGLPTDLALPTADPSKLFDASRNHGNKSLSSNGLIRMLSFAEWAFQRPERYVIVAGHSLWFRSFFRVFLPTNVRHPSKDRKMHNCGMVAFTLIRSKRGGEVAYQIDPESILPLHKGFQ
eukprot:c1830_g1_i1.p1 GENE.c1830_g1_i1~~c1830_g1_i1.p1  ORF type:complete len:355 (+),score=60.85 c1830_g1_i1:36-1067(+)